MKIVKRAVVVMVLALTASAALAQSRNTGALRGVVTDETGGRIPGVLVILESPDMIGGQKAVTTDGQGTFRFPELPPGTYTITFSITGYQTVKREGIRVEASKTFDVDQGLTPQVGEETIIVSSLPPLVDVTSSATSTIMSEEYLNNIPTGRFQPDTLNLAPGIENSSAYGGGASSANAYQIDGVDVSDPEGGSPWSFLNYNIMKEVQLIGLGAPAEYGEFTGVLFNSVTKSGGNEVSGLVEGYLFPPSWVAKNTNDPGLQPPTIDKSFDTTVQVGGPFIKDRLWYLVNAQYLYDSRSSGGPLRTEEDPRIFTKLTWQINKDNLFEAWIEYDRFDVDGRDGDAFTPIEATVIETAPEWVWNFNWRRIISPATSFELAYTGYTGYYNLDPASGYDESGRINSNGFTNNNSTYFYYADRYRHQVNATFSHFSDAFITGKHDFKFGVELERSRVRSQAGTPGVAYYYDLVTGPGPNAPAYYSYAYIGYNYDLQGINHRASVFVQDSWQINDRWTVNPGLRFDFNRGSVPGDGNAFRTQPIALRLGFAYDLTGKKRTVLKGHYGRYFEALFGNYYSQVGPERTTTAAVYGFDPTVTVFDKNNPDPLLQLVPSFQQNIQMDRDVKHPYVDQFTLGVDHDLGNDFAVSLTLVYRINRDFIESVGRDANFQKVVAIDDSGQPITLFNQIDLTDPILITNPGDLERTYTAAIIEAKKRFNKRWQLNASYVRSHNTGNYDNTFARNAGPSAYLDTPNDNINAYGLLTNDYRDEITIQGQYVIPSIEVTLSADYRYASGTTFNATDRATCFLIDPNDPSTCTGSFTQAPSVTYRVESRGSRRLDATNVLNLRAEKYFSLKGGTRLGIFADAFNLFNAGEDTGVQTRRSSPSFLDPTTFAEPRVIRIGGRYEW